MFKRTLTAEPTLAERLAENQTRADSALSSFEYAARELDNTAEAQEVLHDEAQIALALINQTESTPPRARPAPARDKAARIRAIFA